MSKYNKFFVAVGGVVVMALLREFEVNVPGIDEIVRDLIVGALVAGGVYQVRNI